MENKLQVLIKKSKKLEKELAFCKVEENNLTAGISKFLSEEENINILKKTKAKNGDLELKKRWEKIKELLLRY